MVERRQLSGKLSLTNREREILRLLAKGLTDIEIGEEFSLTVGTVKWYNRQIYGKLGVRNRTEAAIVAEQLGLLGSSSWSAASISPPTSRHILPQYATSFVGRRQELAEIAHLLNDPDCRLLTLTGPGGSGKTRLALEAAGGTSFGDGVYFVPLQPLQSSEQVTDTIISVLRLRPDEATGSTQTLLDYLQEANLLLVLDNFEHVLDASALIVDILSVTAQVKLLVTSREPLKIKEEWVREVRGLTYPSDGEISGPSDYGALQLFAECARRLKANFALENEFEHAVRIAQVVDGLPLALELAAGWLRTLSCAAIVSELTQSTDILTSNTRDIPERHRSMRAVFDHSWRLLGDNERTVLQRLSVFRGGCTRQAALQVTGTSLPVLVGLVEKSLVQYYPETDRYDLQELLRQYAEEKLKDSPADQVETQNRHSAYYADFMGQREDPIRTDRQHQIILEIDAELDNVRVAWQWSVEQGASEEIKKHLFCLAKFYWYQGRLREGETTFERATHHLGGNDGREKSGILAQLYTYQGSCSVGLGYFEKGRELVLESVAILRGLGMRWELAHSLLGLGGTYRYLGVYDEGAKALDEGIAIYRAMGDDWWLGYILYNRAILSREVGQFDEAEDLLRESIDLFRPSRDLSMLSEAFLELGRVMQARGNYHAAKSLYQEGLEAAHVFPLSNNYGYALLYLGTLSQKTGEDEEAVRYFFQALQTAKDAAIRRLQMDVLLGIAELLITRGDKERAVELLALSADDSASYFATRNRAQQLLHELESELPASVFQSLWEKGKTTTLNAAIETLYGTSLFETVLI